MASEFVKFQEYIERLRTIYFDALSAFYVYEAIQELIAPNIVGEKEAENNLAVLNRFGGFFVITRHTLNFYFLLELAKMLDSAKQSLHLSKLINFANSNTNKLNVEEFKKLNLGRPFLQELVSGYEGVKKEDFEIIEKKLEATKGIREKIKKYRDQYLAHEDLKKKEISISQKEVIEIFSLIAEILNIFSSKTNHSTTTYSYVESDCKSDTRRIVEYLKRFEPYRLEENEKELLGMQE